MHGYHNPTIEDQLHLQIDWADVLAHRCTTHLVDTSTSFRDGGQFISWHPTKTGMFSVKSAHYVTWKFKYEARGTTHGPSSASLNRTWDVMWKLPCPAKVKIFSGEYYMELYHVELHWLIDTWRLIQNAQHAIGVKVLNTCYSSTQRRNNPGQNWDLIRLFHEHVR